MKKFIKTSASLIAILGLALLAHVSFASANYSINTDPNDCQTVSISNYTTNAGVASPCWNNSSVSASVGDTIDVALYYNNSGNADANNVSFSITDPSSQPITGSNGTVSFTGSIKVGGTVVSSGQVTLNVSGGPATLAYDEVAIYNQGTGQNNIVSNGQGLLTSSGYQFGTLSPGWSNQGSIEVSFKIEAATQPCTNCNNTGQEPSVSTYNISNLDSTNGNVTLNGYFNANGADTTTSFRYQVNGGSWVTVGSQDRGVTYGNISTALTGLTAGSYQYEAVASNQYGTVYGSSVPFTIVGNPLVCGSGYVLSGNTCVPITPVCGAGYYLSGNTCVPVTPVCGSGYYLSGNTCIPVTPVCGAGYYVSGNTCIPIQQTCGYGYYASGNTCLPIQQTCSYGYYLSGNTCIPNTPVCGSGYYASGNTCLPIQQIQTNSVPSITTLGTISVGGTVAVVDGYYNANGCSVNTYFNYGTSQSMGLTTNAVNRGNNSGSMAQSLANLSPNTTYYYQAVGQNCAGTNTGAIQSFTTSGTTTNDTNVRYVYQTITTNGGGGGSSFVTLTITNNEDVVTEGNETPYDVTWKNISGKTLNNLVLEVNFPSQMTITSSDQGSIEPKKSSVILHIDQLDPAETGQMTVTGDISGGMKQGDPVVAQAVMAFQNPTSGATENAMAYDADTFSPGTNVLGASIFGLGFLPSSLGGWLLIILILLIIIIIAHYYFVGRKQNMMVVHHQAGLPPQGLPPQAAPINPPQPPAGAQAGDYIVYRPTPKQ